MNCLNTQYLSNAAEALLSQYLGSYQFKAHHQYQTHCVYFCHRFLSYIILNNFFKQLYQYAITQQYKVQLLVKKTVFTTCFCQSNINEANFKQH